MVEQVLLAGLADALPEVLTLLDAKAALDTDVARLMAAVPSLVRAVRYGDVRGTDTAALVAVVDALSVRTCAGLPAAVGSLGDDAALTMRRRIDGMHAALALHAQTEHGATTRTRWIDTLRQLAERRDVHGLVAGRLVRLLVDAGEIPRPDGSRRLAARLSVGVSTAEKAAWAEGFLAGSGLLLVHDTDLLATLDGWVASLPPDEFVDVVPLLRRTFGEFTPSERRQIADSVRHLATGGRPRSTAAEAIDPGRAAGVLRTVASILAGPDRARSAG
jgi:hypothetical protein